MSKPEIAPVAVEETPDEETKDIFLKTFVTVTATAIIGVAAAYTIFKRRKSDVILEEVATTDETIEDVA